MAKQMKVQEKQDANQTLQGQKTTCCKSGCTRQVMTGKVTCVIHTMGSKQQRPGPKREFLTLLFLVFAFGLSAQMFHLDIKVERNEAKEEFLMDSSVASYALRVYTNEEEYDRAHDVMDYRSSMKVDDYFDFIESKEFHFGIAEGLVIAYDYASQEIGMQWDYQERLFRGETIFIRALGYRYAVSRFDEDPNLYFVYSYGSFSDPTRTSFTCMGNWDVATHLILNSALISFAKKNFNATVQDRIAKRFQLQEEY